MPEQSTLPVVLHYPRWRRIQIATPRDKKIFFFTYISEISFEHPPVRCRAARERRDFLLDTWKGTFFERIVVPNGKPLSAKSIGIALARREVTCLGTDSSYSLTAV